MSIFCIADAATAASVVICISSALFFCRFRFYGVLMSPVFLNTYLPSYTLVTVGPLRYEMLVFPIHLSFIFISTAMGCVSGRLSSHLNRQLKENIKWKDQRYNDSSTYTIYIIINNFVFAVVVVPRIISAFKQRKWKKKHYSTSLCFALSFFIHLSLFQYYIHIKIGWWIMTHTHTQNAKTAKTRIKAFGIEKGR